MRPALLVIALVLVVPGRAAGAERYVVDRPLASVRNAPGSFAIGHVFAGARVDVVAWRRGWAYASWGAGRCGWLMGRGLVATGVATATVCPPPQTLAPARLFARGSYQRGCEQGCVSPARVIPCADRTVYANYFAGTFADPAGREPVGRGTRGVRVPRYAGVRRGYPGFGVRYVTADGVATLIKDARRGAPVWRFVHSDCVERLSLVARPGAIGAFRLRGHLRRAIRAFGIVRERQGCAVRWPRIGLTARFCPRFAGAVISQHRIRGASLVHTWTTPAGLRLGHRVARLRRLYPSARRFHGTYRVSAGVRAVIARGRVAAFRISP